MAEHSAGKPFYGHTGGVHAVALSPDGKTIVSSSYDETGRVWDLAGKPSWLPFQGHTGAVLSVAASSASQTIVSAGEDGTVRLWDYAGKPLAPPFPDNTGPDETGVVLAVALSPDGQAISSPC